MQRHGRANEMQYIWGGNGAGKHSTDSMRDQCRRPADNGRPGIGDRLTMGYKYNLRECELQYTCDNVLKPSKHITGVVLFVQGVCYLVSPLLLDFRVLGAHGHIFCAPKKDYRV